MKEIVAVECITAASGRADELRQALSKIVPLCRSGAGCLQYDLFEPREGIGKFLILMRWRDFEDLQRHESSKYIDDFARKYEGILYTEATQTEWKSIH